MLHVDMPAHFGDVHKPSQREWSAFAAQVADPDGHLWMILVQPLDWADSGTRPRTPALSSESRHHLGVSDDLMNAINEFQRCIEARDRAAAEEILEPAYALVLVAPSRAEMPRAQWLEVLEDYIVHDYVVEEQIVDEDGSEAAVLWRVDMRATVLGADRSGVFVISDFWRQRDGRWRIWRRHSTPFLAGRMPGT
jgi:hypothetical protein